MRGHLLITVGVVAAWLVAPATGQVVSGGKVQPHDSPGVSIAPNWTFGPGGVTSYNWQIDDAGPSGTYPNAPGIAGGTSNITGQSDFGWSLFETFLVPGLSGNFTWTATAGSPLTVTLQTLAGQTTVGNDIAGPMQNFDNTQSYSWQFVTWLKTYTGPIDPATLRSATIFDLTDGPFANVINPQGKFGWHLVDNSPIGGHLDLTYTVPEPDTFALVAAGLLAVWRCRRIRGQVAPRLG